MPDALAYIRVSSTNKAHHEAERATQLHAITAWCEENGHQLLPHVFEDLGVSGTTDPKTREGWAELLGALDATGVIVVVTEAGRVARNSFFLESAIFDVRQLGSSLYDVSDGEFPDPADESPEAWFSRQIMMLIPELERRKLVERMARGKARVRSEGGYTGGAKPISDEDRRAILTMSTVGASIRSIADTVGVSQTTVRRVVGNA